MSVRPASPGDLPAISELWRAFSREVPPSRHRDLDEALELAEIEELVDAGLGFVEDEEGVVTGYALGKALAPRLGELTDLYVAPEARNRGVAAALAEAVVAELGRRGAEAVEVEVAASNAHARVVYQRWGLREESLRLVAPVGSLRERLAPGRHAVSFASMHVQTDDLVAVERAVAGYAPRIGSGGQRIEGPANGWTVVYDEVCDRDPTVLLRFAREISSRMGAIVIAISMELDDVVRLIALDRGGIVDEYLSVPEFYGPLPPGDVIGLAANATVLSRLTGADPASVRAVARTAATPAELPPARELVGSLAALLGLTGADRGYADG